MTNTDLGSVETRVEILVTGNKVLLFQCSGDDVLDELVEALRELGLQLEKEFDSPCG